VWVLLLFLVLSFGLGALLGAPWLPSHRQAVSQALDLAELKPGMHLLDLGSGSGSLLIAAAQRGIQATGIEVNPLLWLVSWIRVWPYRQLVRVRLGDFWQANWPAVDCIYIFLIGHYMGRFADSLERKAKLPVKVVSYTFKVPGQRPIKEVSGLYLYSLD
jgi:16S rRNA A1518/A1519 N6-dimethyltransferase RsmA/KsgA/DIM1 with predicted DNA glycosylase/AP lyase activity